MDSRDNRECIIKIGSRKLLPGFKVALKMASFI
jgi:hypothetical protein